MQVIVDAYPDEKFAGRITYMAHVLDEKTRAAQARVEIDNHDGRLRPGMFATAIIDAAPPEDRDAIVLPSEAIQSIHGKPFAFVEEKPGHYAARELTLGKESGATVEITSGVAAGDRVVTRGAFYLKSMLLKEEVAAVRTESPCSHKPFDGCRDADADLRILSPKPAPGHRYSRR